MMKIRIYFISNSKKNKDMYVILFINDRFTKFLSKTWLITKTLPLIVAVYLRYTCDSARIIGLSEPFVRLYRVTLKP